MGLWGNIKSAFDQPIVSTPRTSPFQEKNVQELQNLLAASSKNAISALSNVAENPTQTAQDAQAVRNFQQNQVPAFMQGAAANNAGGYSSVGGAIANSGAQLSAMLEDSARDRMYNANNSLLEMYNKLSGINTRQYERGQSGVGSLMTSLSNLATNAASGKTSYADWASTGASIGGMAGGGVGAAIGAGVGLLGKFLKGV